MSIRLTFSWWKPWPDRDASPICSCAPTASDVDVLACLLMDDGGLSFDSAASWVDEAISRIDAVLAGSLASADWDRERWGASFTPEMTTMSSLLDETCSQEIETSSFRSALVAWREFVGTSPSDGGEVNV